MNNGKPPWPWTPKAISSWPGTAPAKTAAAMASMPSSFWCSSPPPSAASSASTRTPSATRLCRKLPAMRPAIMWSCGSARKTPMAALASMPSGTTPRVSSKAASSASIPTRRVSKSPPPWRWMRVATSWSPGQITAVKMAAETAFSLSATTPAAWLRAASSRSIPTPRAIRVCPRWRWTRPAISSSPGWTTAARTAASTAFSPSATMPAERLKAVNSR